MKLSTNKEKLEASRAAIELIATGLETDFSEMSDVISLSFALGAVNVIAAQVDEEYYLDELADNLLKAFDYLTDLGPLNLYNTSDKVKKILKEIYDAMVVNQWNKFEEEIREQYRSDRKPAG